MREPEHVTRRVIPLATAAAFLIVGLNITSTRQGSKPEWSFSR